MCLHVEPHNYTLLDIEELNSTGGQDATDCLNLWTSWNARALGARSLNMEEGAIEKNPI